MLKGKITKWDSIQQFKKAKIAELEEIFINNIAQWHIANTGYNEEYISALRKIGEKIDLYMKLFNPFYTSIKMEE